LKSEATQTRRLRWTNAVVRQCALGLGILVLVGAAAEMYVSVEHLVVSMSWVTHTREVEQTLQRVASDLTSAESSRRGYYISHDPEDLADFERSVIGIPATIEHLRTLTSDNPHQQARLPGLQALVNDRIALLQAAVAVDSQNSIRSGDQSDLYVRGRKTMEATRQALAEMEGEEISLLAQRQATASAQARRSLLVTLGGMLLAVAFVAFAAIVGGIDRRHRDRAEHNLTRQRSMLQSVLDSLGEGVLVADRSGNIVLVNEQADRLLGIGLGPRNQTNWGTEFKLLMADGVTQYALGDLPLSLALRGQSTDNVRVLVRRPGASEGVWISVTGRPLHGEDGSAGGVIAFSDVSEQRRSELEVQSAHVRTAEALKVVERQAHDSAMLNKLVERLQSCRNLDESYKMIGPILPHLLPATSGALYVTSASRNILENVCSWGEARPGESNFATDDCWALRRGRVQATELDFELRCRHLDVGSSSPATCIPMIAHGETLGILCVVGAAREPSVHSQAPPTPHSNADQLRLSVGAAEQISLAIANLQLRDKLRSQSIRDPLTGLFNRRYMEESLVRELHRAKRKKAPLTVLMIDIDHFKRFNDTMGHEAGDALLREFGVFLREHVRVDDTPCRYGGEEFTVILPDADSEGALGRAESLREGARRISVGTQLGVPSGVTISVGLATYPDHGDNIADLVRTADAALYVAKSAGRDRVVVSDGSRVTVSA